MLRKEDIKVELLIGQKIKKDNEEQIIEEIDLKRERIKLLIVEKDSTLALIFGGGQHMDTFLEEYMEEIETLQNSLILERRKSYKFKSNTKCNT